MSNTDHVGAGFAWRRSEGVGDSDSWKRDLVLALVIAVASSFLLMIGEAYSKPHSSLQTNMDSRWHDPTMISTVALQN